RSLLIFVSLIPPAPSVFYTLSLHDALPICICSTLSKKQCSTLESHNLLPKSLTPHPESRSPRPKLHRSIFPYIISSLYEKGTNGDRKSTRLNSSHVSISYAVFCLKTKNTL